MKFYLLIALGVLTFGQESLAQGGNEEGIWTSWKVPMNQVNENEKPSRQRYRIIGGNESSLGLIPYQASLLIKKHMGTSLCGGSLIAPNWIVTAAHCLIGALSFQVRLGTMVYNTGGQYFESTEGFFVYPKYNSKSTNYDIALIRLPSDAMLDDNVQPIKIADSSLNFTSVRASGWGVMLSGKISYTLRYADLINMDYQLCRKYYMSGIVTNNTVCTISPTKESTCFGDSGGPLVDNTSKQLVGVVSFVSSQGCTVGRPAGYTKVANFRTWIQEVTGISDL